MKNALVCMILFYSSAVMAQSQTYTDQYGNVVARSHSYGNTTNFTDQYGNNLGSARTFGNSTMYTDQYGNVVGRRSGY